MQEIIDNLYIGNQYDSLPEGWAVINAAKCPWHQQAVGYTKSLDSTHPNYLIHETEDALSLNLVDAPFEFKPQYTDPIFKKAFEFINANRKSRPVLVRCNVGRSRSPSLVMAYLVKMMLLDGNPYEEALQEFKEIYPAYEPGKGVEAYLKNGWERIIKL